MATAHEELLVLKETASASLDRLVTAESEASRYISIFAIRQRKQAKQRVQRIIEMNAEYEKLGKEYLSRFHEVLHEKHGIDPNDLVSVGDGSLLSKCHSFAALIDHRVRKMEAITIGNRIVFFLEGVSLGEDEKATYIN